MLAKLFSTSSLSFDNIKIPIMAKVMTKSDLVVKLKIMLIGLQKQVGECVARLNEIDELNKTDRNYFYDASSVENLLSGSQLRIAKILEQLDSLKKEHNKLYMHIY
jgi:archaellum component FlaC